MSDLDEILVEIIQNNNLKPQVKYDEAKKILVLDKIYKSRKPPIETGLRKDLRIRREFRSDQESSVSLVAAAFLDRNFDLVKILSEHGFPVIDALYFAVHNADEDFGFDMIRYFLTYDPDVDLKRTGEFCYEKSLQFGTSVKFVQQDVSVKEAAAMKKPPVPLIQVYLDLKRALNNDIEMASANEAKVSLKISVPAYQAFTSACNVDSLLVIDYLASRLRKNEKEKFGSRLFILTREAIRLLSHGTYRSEVKNEQAKDAKDASSVNETPKMLHQYLANVLLKEWEQHVEYSFILAYYAIYCAHDDKFVTEQLKYGLQVMTNNKQPNEVNVILYEFTKEIFRVLEKEALLNSKTHKFLLEVILDKWDLVGEPSVKRSRRDLVFAIFKEELSPTEFDKAKCSIIDQLPPDAKENPNVLSLDDDGEDSTATQTSPLIANSMLAGNGSTKVGTTASSSLTPK